MLKEFTHGGQVNVRKYAQSFSPDEIVGRAESKLGERGFHLVGSHGG
jgi:hypothetical protein